MLSIPLLRVQDCAVALLLEGHLRLAPIHVRWCHHHVGRHRRVRPEWLLLVRWLELKLLLRWLELELLQTLARPFREGPGSGQRVVQVIR